jgi:glycosyltransferase involved in cell wall biosynthesis
MHPQISVLIPCYNHAHYLAYALESLLAQSFSNWEAIIIDDGSTDETYQVAAKFVDPRIRYVYQENQGLSAARNAGLNLATTEIIALLDADDVWKENYLEMMVPVLLDQQDVVAVYCGFYFIDDSGQEIGIPNITVLPPEEFNDYFTNHGNWLIPSGVIFRKTNAIVEGCFDESLQALEDSYMWSKLTDQGLFFGIPHALVGYRRHDSNMTSDPQRMVSSQYRIIERYFGTPQGDPSKWTDRKVQVYTRYFETASIRYLAFGDVQMSAYYFLRMHEINPESGTKIGVWRSLSRVHLPIEIRNAPDVLDWKQAEKDISCLLSQLERMRQDSKLLNERFSKIAGGAYLGLADEAVRAKKYKLASQWLSTAAKNNLAIIYSRPYWGTIFRGFNNAFTPAQTNLS